jgi:uncharacterized protein (DUF433 family)
VPAALELQWLREWGLFTDAPASVIEGTARQRRAAFETCRRGFLLGNERPTDSTLRGLASPKLVELRELIGQLALAQGRKVVVFSQWRRPLLLRRLSEGASQVDLLQSYPRLTREDLQAAMRYAADTVAHEEIVFLDPGRSV